jgi:EF-P beta-lysylation protein EpmB
MIESKLWENALSQAITKPEELFEILDLDPCLLPAAKASAALFPLKVPRSFVNRMRKGDRYDPLLLQILPVDLESHYHPDYTTDPLNELAVNPIPGLLHKYHGRVLLTFVGACGINCRYCFRRHFPYADNNPGRAGWQKALDYIAADESIAEVILSGGDPLVANDRSLANFTDSLANIAHVKRLRIHSRMPIVLPERISSSFINWIQQLKQQPILVTHCNHAQEIDSEVKQAMLALKQAGVVLLNQAVLLKGVNDHAQTLIELSEALFAVGIQPYYLHIMDKVQGAAHFDLDLAPAKQLHKQLEEKLSGYLVPKLVYEQAGAPSKLPVI